MTLRDNQTKNTLARDKHIGKYKRVAAKDYHPDCRADLIQIVALQLYDLMEGTHKKVAESRCWDVQLGAQVQWGRSDEELYFNDMIPGKWKPFGVRLNPSTGSTTIFAGSVYMVSPDGRLAASPCLLRTARTQPGYGGIVPPEHLPKNVGVPEDDGLYLTDLKTGETYLHVTLRQIADAISLEDLVDTKLSEAAFYGFHAKWSPDGRRLMFVIRNKPETSNKRQSFLVTMNADGSNIQLALGWDVWSKGGHHPNWYPCSNKILMNLKDESGVLRFFSFNYDGSGRQPISVHQKGSGHPTICPFSERHILTDAYATEKLATKSGATAPLRLLDTATDKLVNLIEIDTRPTAENDGLMRIDPHPAWHPTLPYIAFNARDNGVRNVYVADLSEAIRQRSGRTFSGLFLKLIQRH